MKNIVFTVTLACLLMVSAFSNDTITCSEKKLQKLCTDAGSSNCTWTANSQQNTCTQAVDCPNDVGVDKCADEVNTPFCQLTGSSCADNTTVCNVVNNTCNTGAQCEKTESCTPIAAGYDCPSNNNKTGTCKSNQAWCMQDPAVTPTCIRDNTKVCPAGTQAKADNCYGPCSATAICSSTCTTIQNPTAENCLTANGCTLTEGTPNTCTSTTSCTGLSGTTCGTTAGCQVNGYTCSDTDSKYCDEQFNVCDTSTIVQQFCNYSANKSCVTNQNYCKLGDPSMCGTAGSAQCAYSVTCSNPQTGMCSGYTTQKNCVAQLCTYTPPNACVNLNSNTNATCNPLSGSESTCMPEGKPGCLFVSGGTCSTTSSGGNTSALVIAFSSALLALAFAL